MKFSAAVLSTFFIYALAGATPFDQSHTALNRILNENVKLGAVDYKKMSQSMPELEKYVESVAAVKDSDFQTWSKNDQLAFLLNAYNSYTLRMIEDFMPALDQLVAKGDKKFRSIRYIGPMIEGGNFSLLGSVAPSKYKQWLVSKYSVQKDGKKIDRIFSVLGKESSLKDLEDKVIRPYGEARIHFALVCAALSCPFLRSEAYVGSKLDAQLDDQGHAFLASTFRNRWLADQKKMGISEIFGLYPGDFKKAKGSVWKFIEPYLTDATRSEIVKAIGKDNEPKTKEVTYHWVLNDRQCVALEDCPENQFAAE